MSENDPPIFPTYGSSLKIKHIMTEFRAYIEPRYTQIFRNTSQNFSDSIELLAATIEFIIKLNLQNKL
ncbi:hypothetical protein FWK35_00028162 [Aphis craccivora]|uniref:Uncharacterized protein n=1 Tax=Aphis craccivora TaxID=307492 RepID=A0A6G0XZ72_APHCR|nr:hypothetical protein FWK35_00028162 [Aphis craccivora]